MPCFDFVWTDEATAHLDEHSISPEDFEAAVNDPVGKAKSRTNDQESPRLTRPASAEEVAKFRRYREQIAEDLPELRRQAKQVEAEMRESVMLDSTVSGQLRRAVFESRIEPRELAAQTGLSPKLLAEFLVGTAALDSRDVDKLAAFLKHELRPIG